MNDAAYIGFGANLGDRTKTFAEALRALSELPGTVVTKVSRLYETEPVGLVDQGPRFLNAVIRVSTDLPPLDLMAAMREIELKLGKESTHRSDMSRFVDLDLLLYGNRTIEESGLTVPHPRMLARAFVLVPLAEVAAGAVVPGLNSTVMDLLEALPKQDRKGVVEFPFSGVDFPDEP